MARPVVFSVVTAAVAGPGASPRASDGSRGQEAVQDLICGRALELPGLQDRDYPLHLGIGLAVLWPTIAIILVSMHVRSRRAERS